MKKYIFIATAIFILFTSCSSSTSSTSSKRIKYESDCFNVKVCKCFGNKRYEIVTYEDSVKMKRYTFLVVDFFYGGGCTLMDTEDMK